MASPPNAWFFTRSEGGQHFGFAPFLTYIPPMSKQIYEKLLFSFKNVIIRFGYDEVLPMRFSGINPFPVILI